MGYDGVEFAGMYNYKPEEIKALCEKYSLTPISAHVPLDDILNRTDALMEEHARFGCKNIGLGAMGSKIIMDEKACFETIEKLEAMTAVCSVGLDMINIPGDTSAEVISAIIADEAAIGMVNSKTTAVRVIPAVGLAEGEEVILR